MLIHHYLKMWTTPRKPHSSTTKLITRPPSREQWTSLLSQRWNHSLFSSIITNNKSKLMLTEKSYGRQSTDSRINESRQWSTRSLKWHASCRVKKTWISRQLNRWKCSVRSWRQKVSFNSLKSRHFAWAYTKLLTRKQLPISIWCKSVTTMYIKQRRWKSSRRNAESWRGSSSRLTASYKW